MHTFFPKEKCSAQLQALHIPNELDLMVITTLLFTHLHRKGKKKPQKKGEKTIFELLNVCDTRIVLKLLTSFIQTF